MAGDGLNAKSIGGETNESAQCTGQSQMGAAKGECAAAAESSADQSLSQLLPCPRRCDRAPPALQRQRCSRRPTDIERQRRQTAANRTDGGGGARARTAGAAFRDHAAQPDGRGHSFRPSRSVHVTVASADDDNGCCSKVQTKRQPVSLAMSRMQMPPAGLRLRRLRLCAALRCAVGSSGRLSGDGRRQWPMAICPLRCGCPSARTRRTQLHRIALHRSGLRKRSAADTDTD